jgi:hypothetical protein
MVVIIPVLTKPEITFSSITSTTTGCIPNIELSITSDPLNNSFQWVYNGQDIPEQYQTRIHQAFQKDLDIIRLKNSLSVVELNLHLMKFQ